MTTPHCPAKIKAWKAEDGEFRCRLADSPHPQHEATGLYEHQTISWFDGDRRQFRGEFVACDESTCILPSGHHGNHAA